MEGDGKRGKNNHSGKCSIETAGRGRKGEKKMRGRGK